MTHPDLLEDRQVAVEGAQALARGEGGREGGEALDDARRALEHPPAAGLDQPAARVGERERAEARRGVAAALAHRGGGERRGVRALERTSRVQMPRSNAAILESRHMLFG